MTFDTLVIHKGIESTVTMLRKLYGQGERPFPSLFIYGPQGTGKTHILLAAAKVLKERSFQQEVMAIPTIEIVPSNNISIQDLALKTDEELTRICCILLDDIQLMPQVDSGNLWNICNRVTRLGISLLMAARISAEELFPDNDHLRSRINSGLVFQLTPPQDQDRILILDKMAKERSIRIPQEVSNYLVTRKTRNIKDLAAALDMLDRTSLELKRRITLPLIKMLEADGKI